MPLERLKGGSADFGSYLDILTGKIRNTNWTMRITQAILTNWPYHRIYLNGLCFDDINQSGDIG